MLLIGYFFDITSERKLCDEISMHIGYRWFCGLRMDEKVPNHSTFSKNRHGRFKESGIFQDIFDEIVKQCIESGIVSGEHVTVDGSFVKANAALKNMEPIVVQLNPVEYIKEIEKQNPVKSGKPWEPDDDYKNRGKKISNKTHVSKSDPDSRIGRKGKSSTDLYYCINYLMDNKNQMILSVKPSTPDRGGEQRAAKKMLTDLLWKFKIRPDSLGADKGYATGEFIHHLVKSGVKPHIPIQEHIRNPQKGIYPVSEFKYDAENNQYICPQGKILKYSSYHKYSRQLVWRAKKKDCKNCTSKTECTRSMTLRSISRHIYSEDIEKAKKMNTTKSYISSQIKRKWIEGLFGEAKEFMGLRVAKFRRRWNIQEQFIMTALAQNIKRMVKILARSDGGVPSSTKASLFSVIMTFFSNFSRYIYLCFQFEGQGY